MLYNKLFVNLKKRCKFCYQRASKLFDFNVSIIHNPVQIIENVKYLGIYVNNNLS